MTRLFERVYFCREWIGWLNVFFFSSNPGTSGSWWRSVVVFCSCVRLRTESTSSAPVGMTAERADSKSGSQLSRQTHSTHLFRHTQSTRGKNGCSGALYLDGFEILHSYLHVCLWHPPPDSFCLHASLERTMSLLEMHPFIWHFLFQDLLSLFHHIHRISWVQFTAITHKNRRH